MKKQLTTERKVNIIVICAAVLAIIINTFFFQLCIVSGRSMYPTFSEKNLLLMDKVTDDYERMDIIILKKNGVLMVKRIVALPGENVKIESDKIFINGSEIQDIVECATEPGIAENEIQLGEKEYFVLGDNRGNSVDSRNEKIGIIKESEIVGEVIISVFPFKKI